MERRNAVASKVHTFAATPRREAARLREQRLRAIALRQEIADLHVEEAVANNRSNEEIIRNAGVLTRSSRRELEMALNDVRMRAVERRQAHSRSNSPHSASEPSEEIPDAEPQPPQQIDAAAPQQQPLNNDNQNDDINNINNNNIINNNDIIDNNRINNNNMNDNNMNNADIDEDNINNNNINRNNINNNNINNGNMRVNNIIIHNNINNNNNLNNINNIINNYNYDQVYNNNQQHAVQPDVRMPIEDTVQDPLAVPVQPIVHATPEARPRVRQPIANQQQQQAHQQQHEPQAPRPQPPRQHHSQYIIPGINEIVVLPDDDNDQCGAPTGNHEYKCPICLNTPWNRIPYSTGCGHVYCYECLTTALADSNRCPSCRKTLYPTSIFRLYI